MAKDSGSSNQAPTALDSNQTTDIVNTLHHLLSRTREGGTICPSQIPRALHGANPAAYPDWRAMMDPVRDVVWEQVREGVCEVTQRGERREYEERGEIKGPIRVKKGESWHEGLKAYLGDLALKSAQAGPGAHAQVRSPSHPAQGEGSAEHPHPDIDQHGRPEAFHDEGTGAQISDVRLAMTGNGVSVPGGHEGSGHGDDPDAD